VREECIQRKSTLSCSRPQKRLRKQNTNRQRRKNVQPPFNPRIIYAKKRSESHLIYAGTHILYTKRSVCPTDLRPIPICPSPCVCLLSPVSQRYSKSHTPRSSYHSFVIFLVFVFYVLHFSGQDAATANTTAKVPVIAGAIGAVLALFCALASARGTAPQPRTTHNSRMMNMLSIE
jgi:hypothetical protein